MSLSTITNILNGHIDRHCSLPEWTEVGESRLRKHIVDPADIDRESRRRGSGEIMTNVMMKRKIIMRIIGI